MQKHDDLHFSETGIRLEMYHINNDVIVMTWSLWNASGCARDIASESEQVNLSLKNTPKEKGKK